MASLPVTFSDLKVYFCSLKPFYFTYLGAYRVYYHLRCVYTWLGKRTWLV